MNEKVKETARDKLLRAAGELFYRDGIAATGIDSITKRAGVAKMSLYNNFASKDDLVVAYLHARHEEWLELYRVRLEKTRTPDGRVLAVVDAYRDHADGNYEQGFRGCGLLNAGAELVTDHPGRAVVREHKAEVLRILQDTLRDAGRKNADRLGEHIFFIIEGAIMHTGLEASLSPMDDARVLVAELLDA